jgi:hypothetical protein
VDPDTHGRRLGQNKAQAGFERRVDFVEGSQEARALDEEFAIGHVRVRRLFFFLFPHVHERKVPLQGTRCAAPAAFTKP